jgi:hypothetical protein
MFWLFCGTVLLLMIFTVEKDEKAVQDKVAFYSCRFLMLLCISHRSKLYLKVRYSIGRQTTSWESHQDHEGSPRVDTETSERTPVKQSDTELI